MTSFMPIKTVTIDNDIAPIALDALPKNVIKEKAFPLSLLSTDSANKIFLASVNMYEAHK